MTQNPEDTKSTGHQFPDEANPTIAAVLHNSERAFGDRPAFIEGTATTSLGAHLGDARAFAAALRRRGIKPGDRVAVLGETSRIYVAIWHAALLGHFILMPLNSRLTSLELNHVLANGSPAVLVHDDAFRELALTVAEGRDGSLVPVSLNALMAEEWDGLAEDPSPAPDDLAVIMYTSGTAGLPKGVEMTQRSLALFYACADQFWDLQSPGTCIYTATPLFHISAAWCVMGPPLHGNVSVIVPSFNMGRMLVDSRQHKLTHFSLIPTMLAPFLDHPEFNPEEQKHIRYILCGGAPADAGAIQRLLDTLPNVKLIQMYGSTEAVGGLTYLSGEDNRRGGERLKSCGRPMSGVDIRVRGRDGQLCRPGDVGEVEARSLGMFRRYWQNGQATREALVDGWWRTGDLGKLDEDGYLYIVDRLKDMIITGGENVYSQEVERAIAVLPNVLQVAVIGIPSEKWGEQVHAVIVPQDKDAEFDIDELLGQLRQRIAGFKCPKSVETALDGLPMTASNKVDKKKLRSKYTK